MKQYNKQNYFYNPVTGVPLDIFSYDSNDKGYQIIPEDDNKIKNPGLYEDCCDLNQKEIEFFVLWNNFKDKHELNEKYDICDTIEKFVYMFINENREYIRKNDLVNELILFLDYLLKIGEISFTFFYSWTIKINDNNN